MIHYKYCNRELVSETHINYSDNYERRRARFAHPSFFPFPPSYYILKEA